MWLNARDPNPGPHVCAHVLPNVPTSQPQMVGIIGRCLSLHWKCPLKTPVLKAGSPVSGTMWKVQNLKEVGPRGNLRSLKMCYQVN